VEGESLANAVAQVPGVEQVVKNCRATIRLRSPHDSVSVDLLAVEPNQRLMALRDVHGRVPDTRPGEIWIPSKMAARLRLEKGDPVRVEWAYSSRARHIKTTMRVGGLLDPTLGGMAMGDYQDMRRRLIERIYPDGGYGCMIRCTPQLGFALRRQLERSELVAAVASIGEARDEVEASLGVTIIFVSIMLGFGAVLSWAVLHSVASVGILERMRELATLRSLGFSARATTVAAAVEMYLMALLALVFGLPLGTWLNTQYLSVYETETTSFRSEMPLWAYLMVTAMVLGMVALSLRAGLNRLRTMDLAQATKARE
ncbi:MAG: ABC transporter permease, partial [Armatimonadetes bacterium]|nr:ABC transporter permease [Armatimonadota bacterium]